MYLASEANIGIHRIKCRARSRPVVLAELRALTSISHPRRLSTEALCLFSTNPHPSALSAAAFATPRQPLPQLHTYVTQLSNGQNGQLSLRNLNRVMLILGVANNHFTTAGDLFKRSRKTQLSSCLNALKLAISSGNMLLCNRNRGFSLHWGGLRAGPIFVG
ncbi:hypothetical protein JOM56_012756 [Amanita muscaria]